MKLARGRPWTDGTCRYLPVPSQQAHPVTAQARLTAHAQLTAQAQMWLRMELASSHGVRFRSVPGSATFLSLWGRVKNRFVSSFCNREGQLQAAVPGGRTTGQGNCTAGHAYAPLANPLRSSVCAAHARAWRSRSSACTAGPPPAGPSGRSAQARTRGRKAVSGPNPKPPPHHHPTPSLPAPHACPPWCPAITRPWNTHDGQRVLRILVVLPAPRRPATARADEGAHHAALVAAGRSTVRRAGGTRFRSVHRPPDSAETDFWSGLLTKPLQSQRQVQTATCQRKPSWRLVLI